MRIVKIYSIGTIVCLIGLSFNVYIKEPYGVAGWAAATSYAVVAMLNVMDGE